MVIGTLADFIGVSRCFGGRRFWRRTRIYTFTKISKVRPDRTGGVATSKNPTVRHYICKPGKGIEGKVAPRQEKIFPGT